MATKEEQVREYLGGLQAGLDQTMALLQIKLIWLDRILRENARYIVPINDGDFDPPRQVMLIDATPERLKGYAETFMSEARRSFFNDVFILLSRYAILITNCLRGVVEHRPEFTDEIRDEALVALSPYVSKDDRDLLEFLRRVRNTVVHYESRHNVRNRLRFTLDDWGIDVLPESGTSS